MREAWYDIAEICLDGHVTNSSVERSPDRCSKHCEKCGEKTIQHCPHCSSPIRGRYHISGVVGFSNYKAPKHCHQCGKPFPWVESLLQASKELAGELEEFSREDVDILSVNLADLTSDNPKTQVAAIRVKKLLAKAGKPVADAFYKLLVDVISETARKTIWPD